MAMVELCDRVVVGKAWMAGQGRVGMDPWVGSTGTVTRQSGKDCLVELDAGGTELWLHEDRLERVVAPAGVRR